jgi:hypothetical protein
MAKFVRLKQFIKDYTKPISSMYYNIDYIVSFAPDEEFPLRARVFFKGSNSPVIFEDSAEELDRLIKA